MNSATNFIIKYKWWILAAIVLLVIIIIAYKRGKSYRPQQVKLPPDIQTGNPDTFDPTNYTDSIFRDIDCVACTHDSGPYNNANTLSNSQITAIWNDWNRRYYQKWSMDMATAMCGEWTYWNINWANAVCTLYNRFKALGLATNSCDC